MKKPLPIGHDDFEKLRQEDLYYVDKTLLLRDLLDSRAEVTLFTRPRRFGKTLALSMIQSFFEKGKDVTGKELDRRELFSGLKIMEAGEAYTSQMGRFPVIRLSLKSAKQPDFEMAREALVREVRKEYERAYYLLQSPRLSPEQKETYKRILRGRGTQVDDATSIEFLSACLYQHYREKVIILIDEYDVPLENAWVCGFYDPMVGFIRSLFESALKTNGFLRFAVITGCLRISRESIFTGLNNLKIVSITNPDYAERFGFLQEEVDDMLAYYDRTEKRREAKLWYDGYRFGGEEVYNPWSIINYVDRLCAEPTAFPRPYSSTGSAFAKRHAR